MRAHIDLVDWEGEMGIKGAKFIILSCSGCSFCALNLLISGFIAPVTSTPS